MKAEKEQEFKEILARIAAKDERLQKVNLEYFGLKKEDVLLLVHVLPQSCVTNLNLRGNDISTDGVIALAKVLAQSQVTSLDLGGNHIEYTGALAQLLAQSQLKSLDLTHNLIRYSGAKALAQWLPQSQFRSLDLTHNHIEDVGVNALAQVLPQSQLSSLSLQRNNIGARGAKALAQVLAQSKLTSLDLVGNDVGLAGYKALFQAVILSCTITDLDLNLWWNKSMKSILNNHLAINKLLNATQTEDKSTNEFIKELECSALMYIGQPELLDDATFEKPKRLLLKAIGLGSVQAIYLLGNLYLDQFKDFIQAKEHYLKASSMGHVISKLCLEVMEQIETPTKLQLDDLIIKLPLRFSANTISQELALREHELTSLRKPNALVFRY